MDRHTPITMRKAPATLMTGAMVIATATAESNRRTRSNLELLLESRSGPTKFAAGFSAMVGKVTVLKAHHGEDFELGT